MKTPLFAGLMIAAVAGFALTPVFAQDAVAPSSSAPMQHDAMKAAMPHDGMHGKGMTDHHGAMKHAAMKQDGMKHGGMMKKGATNKGGMMKHDGMMGHGG
jgi:pentapeptide MXKDX repeat protein